MSRGDKSGIEGAMLRMHSGRQADLQRKQSSQASVLKSSHNPADPKTVTGHGRTTKDEAGSDAARYAPRELGPFETLRATISLLAIAATIFSVLWVVDTVVRNLNHRSFDSGQTFDVAGPS